MTDSAESQVRAVEERLRVAMLHSQVSELDALLGADLVFTNHLGQVVGKGEDIAAHESGLVKITELSPSGQRIQVIGDVAVVVVRTYVSGSYGDVTASGDFRFTRVWARDGEGNWQVVAGHSCVVAE